MNETSSRSHAVFTLVMTQKRHDEQTKLDAEKVSRISLVDLAGSERANSTGASGSRLKEGANINRSLTTLGKVIAALASASLDASKGTPRKKAADHVPYRDSVLTWLLKDSLGGNSKTAMIAAISPADYEETLSTLRYADQAKKIQNKAVVNEDPNAKLIRELKEELDVLRARAGVGSGAELNGTAGGDEAAPIRYVTATGETKTVTRAELRDQMEQNAKLMSTLNESWEEKMQRTQTIQAEREKALEELGITIDKANIGVRTPRNLPHLVNLNEDALMNECLLYQLKEGSTVVGNVESPINTINIRLSGSKILDEHCRFENLDGVVTLHAMPGSMTMVNGKRIVTSEPKRLRSGYRVILGDFHVFRINNPGEVRKARDRVRSAMSGDEPPQSRPESPASEDGQDADWTYARREAILNHLNGRDVALDSLSNEDLDRLFDDISRVRSRKGRPESRLSESRVSSSALDDDESADSTMRRPFSEYTDDTSLTMDPWANERPFSNVTPASSTSPDPSKQSGSVLTDANGVDASTLPESEAAVLRAKIKRYEERFADVLLQDEPELTPRQRQLAEGALAQWRSRTAVSMAADVLSHAAALKEANIISRELRKSAQYQFVVLDGTPPLSNREGIAGLTEYDDVADSDLIQRPKPCVAVKVIDSAHSSVYVWSLSKLTAYLIKMRNLYAFVDRPQYSQHFDWGDPFYESPSPPQWTFAGAALVSLRPLTRRRTAKYENLPVVNPLEDSVLGSCTVEVKFVSLTAPPGSSTTMSNGSASSALVVGHKLGMQINVSEVSDLDREDWNSAHLQLRLSSIVGPAIEKEDTFASAPIQDLAELRLRKTVAVILTPDTIRHLHSGLAAIEVYIQPTRRYIRKILATDAHSSTLPSPTSGRPRLAETDFVSRQRHDVLVSLELCELDDAGNYEPVQVIRSSSPGSQDGDVFQLRQGLQRKLVLKLRHDSGQQLAWTKVSKLRIGAIRRAGSQDASTDDLVSLAVPSRQQHVEFSASGVAQLDCWAWWDSSIHDSIFLNRVTAAGSRVLLRVEFEAEVPETCSAPLLFSRDIAVAICPRAGRNEGNNKGRSSGGSIITSFFSGGSSNSAPSTPATSSATIYSVDLTPHGALKTRDLWRLDTAGKYIKGQENLDGWQPLGVEYVARHASWLAARRRFADVAGWRQLLSNIEMAPTGQPSPGVVTRCLELWRKAASDGKLQQRSIGVPTAESETGNEDSAASSPSPTMLLSPHVSLLTPSRQVVRRGLLAMPVTTIVDPTWVTRWLVLRRPHLFVYPSDSSSGSTGEAQETTPLLVIHLGGHAAARVERVGNEVSEMLGGRRGVFAVYTDNNSYFLQAKNEAEVQGWISALSGGAGSVNGAGNAGRGR